MSSNLLIVSYRLPFNVKELVENKKAEKNAGGLVSGILSFIENSNVAQVDTNLIKWAGFDTYKYSNKFEYENFELYPLHIQAEIEKKFYHGFSNSTLWPLFHYYPYLTSFKQEYFDAYYFANQQMADYILSFADSNDIIWIHDYHLMLLPGMLRKKNPNLQIGFFLHIPFPSYEIFRLLPTKWREQIMEGLCGADLIGFHTYEYVKYFLESVKKILGYEFTMRKIYSKDRVIKTDVFPISIDYDKFNSANDKENVILEKGKILSQIEGYKVIFSVDRLDYSKGLKYRLDGFERFLELYPEWNEKVVFIMIIVPSREEIKAYSQIKREIEETIGRINGKYSTLKWRPIIYQYKSLSYEELCSFYIISDVALISPIRDGMNLVAKEYVAAKKNCSGVLILSEMAGAASELGEAIIINPTDKQEIGEALNVGLLMDEPEKISRIEAMQKRIRDYNIVTWATDFITQLLNIKEDQILMEVKKITRLVIEDIGFEFKMSNRGLFIFDYDGTLVGFNDTPEKVTKNSDLLLQLKNIAAKHTVVINSGRDKKYLEYLFPDPEIMLVAEHGIYVREKGVWTSNINDSSSEWKDIIRPLMESYVKRCSGSFIEEKEHSIVWHYRISKEELGTIRARELNDEINTYINNRLNLLVLPGKKVIEVKRMGFHKGSAAFNILKKDSYDFIFVCGDDVTDEDMFKVMPEKAITVKIGLSPSNAKYYVNSHLEILKYIKSFSEIVNL